MGESVGDAPVKERCKELAGRLLGALLTGDPTLFAFKPGKSCGGLHTTSPASSMLGLAIRLPTVGNVVVVENAVGKVENAVVVFVVVQVDVPVSTEIELHRVVVDMHRKPSKGQSTTREKNFRKG
jgi:hypothetical protein